MFSGFNKLLKIVLPKRLFYRALIIVAAPTIILQLIITIVFYDSIWIKANKNITRSLVSQLKTIENVTGSLKLAVTSSTGNLEKSYRRYVLSQKDTLGYNGEKSDPLYKSFPW